MRLEKKFPESLTDQGELCELRRWIVPEFACLGQFSCQFGFAGLRLIENSDLSAGIRWGGRARVFFEPGCAAPARLARELCCSRRLSSPHFDEFLRGQATEQIFQIVDGTERCWISPIVEPDQQIENDRSHLTDLHLARAGR
jgi:hypothetical protein